MLFLYGVVATSPSTAASLTLGSAASWVWRSACILSWPVPRGLVIIPLRYLFSVTNALVALLAAGMAGQAASLLNSVNLLPSWGERLWDTSFILADDSFVGRSLHALVGYSARPSGIQFAAWIAALLVLAVLSYPF